MEHKPPYKTHINWNIDDLVKIVQEVSQSAWFLELLIAIIDQTEGFKVSHQEKRDILHTSQTETDLKWMKNVIVGLHIIYICATNHHHITHNDIGLSPLHDHF